MCGASGAGHHGDVTSTVLRTSTAVMGAHTALGSLVSERLSRRAVGVRTLDATEPAEELDRALEGAGTLVLLDRGAGPDVDGTGGSDIALDLVRKALASARRTSVRSLVVLSSAMVYGARDDNPVPLTEDAPVRPDPALPYALRCAELERLAIEFGLEDPVRRVSILRPAVVLGPASERWLRRSAWARRGLPADDTLPPRQFVHVDDLVSAIELACEEPLDGVYNVAPNGWIASDVFRELVGSFAVPWPLPARRWAIAARRRLFGAVVPAGLESYTRAPWVVSSDRLQARGWKPEHTSEEVFVAVHRARGWQALRPRTRQELSLAGIGVLVAGSVVGALVWLRRRRQTGAGRSP